MGTVIDSIIIHSISLPEGAYNNTFVENFFQNQLDIDKDPYFSKISHLKVSSHLYIKRCGQVIQFVDLDKRAWHAGVSNLRGRQRVNDFSIGIEFEGTDKSNFTQEQYTALNRCLKEIRNTYPAIKSENIVGHSDIAPGRKTDPGIGFDWSCVSK